MKAKVLRHKTMTGYHGAILSGVLFRTGTKITPQLYPEDCTKEWLQRSIRAVDTDNVKSLADFDLITISWDYDDYDYK